MSLQPTSAARSPINEEHLHSIIADFDQRLGSLQVKERNDRRMVIEAEETTVEWYANAGREMGGPPLGTEGTTYLTGLLEAQAPGLVAKRNAEALVRDLDTIEKDIGGSGLNLQDERRLRSEIEDLRRNLLRGGRYLGQYDEAMMRMAALVRKARGPWAEDNNLKLERYLGRDRWWLK
jgi:hypothetical protein